MQILPIRISSWENAKQIERGKSNHLTPVYSNLPDLIYRRSFHSVVVELRYIVKTRQTLPRFQMALLPNLSINRLFTNVCIGLFFASHGRIISAWLAAIAAVRRALQKIS
ncbi:MAG: hypothetical protein OES26_25020 [Gammaproteobacteria bacterium]|nr:hypothetical protein [Gammaproteobacteria bacterium]